MRKLKSYEQLMSKLENGFPKPAPLADMLPLPLPLSMHIDPVNACNFRCTFCPTGNMELLRSAGRAKGYMPLDLFKKIIDDIKALCDASQRKLHRLHLYKDGEPLLHSDLATMIAYAKAGKISHSVETTSNCALLTRAWAEKLIESGLDVLRCSIEHVSDSGYRDITKTKTSYKNIVDNISYLFHRRNERKSTKPLIFAKILDCNLTNEDKERFILDFDPISDALNIDALMGWSQTDLANFTLGTAADVAMNGRTKLSNKVACPECFSKLAVNFDGTVSICCVDWSLSTIVGDVKRQTLAEIWNGEALRKLRLLHLSGQRDKIPACASCDYIRGLPHYSCVDDDLDRLLALYGRK